MDNRFINVRNSGPQGSDLPCPKTQSWWVMELGIERGSAIWAAPYTHWGLFCTGKKGQQRLACHPCLTVHSPVVPRAHFCAGYLLAASAVSGSMVTVPALATTGTTVSAVAFYTSAPFPISSEGHLHFSRPANPKGARENCVIQA